MFYKYTVVWYDPYANEEKHSEGTVDASNYGAAIDQVISFYGKDKISELYFREIAPENNHCLSMEYGFKEIGNIALDGCKRIKNMYPSLVSRG